MIGTQQQTESKSYYVEIRSKGNITHGTEFNLRATALQNLREAIKYVKYYASMSEDYSGEVFHGGKVVFTTSSNK